MKRALLVIASLAAANTSARAECRLRPAVYGNGWIWGGWEHSRFVEGVKTGTNPLMFVVATSDQAAVNFRVAFGLQVGVCATDADDGWRARIGFEGDPHFYHSLDPRGGLEAQLDAQLAGSELRLGGRVAYRADDWSRPIADQHLVMIGARATWRFLAAGVDVFRAAGPRDPFKGVTPTEVGITLAIGVDLPIEIERR